MRIENHRVHWNPGMSLEQLEKEVVLKAFEFYKNNKTVTASSLGICIRTLDNKLQKFEEEKKKWESINDERKRESENFLSRCRGKAPEQQVHVESPAHDPQESEVPLHERQEVQDVLHDQVTSLGAKRGRQALSRANG